MTIRTNFLKILRVQNAKKKLKPPKFEASRGREGVRFNLPSNIFSCTYWAEQLFVVNLSNISHLSPLRTNLYVLGCCTYWAVTYGHRIYRLKSRDLYFDPVYNDELIRWMNDTHNLHMDKSNSFQSTIQNMLLNYNSLPVSGTCFPRKESTWCIIALTLRFRCLIRLHEWSTGTTDSE